ncbi:MAG: hypothetical protein ACOCZE_13300 [Planctomycetota bacterium]
MTQRTASKRIRIHANYSAADYAYLREKGYSDDEILAIWDRDRGLGKPAQLHTAKPFDIVGYLNRKEG